VDVLRRAQYGYKPAATTTNGDNCYDEVAENSVGTPGHRPFLGEIERTAADQNSWSCSRKLVVKAERAKRAL